MSQTLIKNIGLLVTNNSEIDGTPLAAQKLARVLTNDPGMGVIRHVDSGYEIADKTAREKHVHIPMLDIE